MQQINRIQNIYIFLHSIFVCIVYIYCVYINEHAFMYIFWDFFCLYIQCIYVYYKLYEYKYMHLIHVNIF